MILTRGRLPVRERPILFSSPMVRAILAGTKNQTRRVVKRYSADCIGWFDDGDGLWAQRFIDPSSGSPYLKSWRDRCPHGRPGDRLWVRETWAHSPDGIIYRATKEQHGTCEPGGEERWRPSIHMPRVASRITLEITGVRVERLQDIGEADAVAEGIQKWPLGYRVEVSGAPKHESLSFESAQNAYRWLWDSITGPGSWDANPWVWVIEFRRVDA